MSKLFKVRGAFDWFYVERSWPGIQSSRSFEFMSNANWFWFNITSLDFAILPNRALSGKHFSGCLRMTFLLLLVLLILCFKLYSLGGNFDLFLGLKEINDSVKTLSAVQSLQNLPNVIFDTDIPYEASNPCLMGLFVSLDDVDPDCSLLCKIPEVEALHVSKTMQVYVDGKKLTPGTWCVPSASAVCNPRTTIVVKNASGWYCVPRDSNFGGEGGNLILACNGSLVDNLLNITYEKAIPSNLVFDSIDEFLPGKTDYRFTCPPDLVDVFNNKLVGAPWNRLELYSNFCVAGINSAVEATPDFTTGKCNCLDFSLQDKFVGYGCTNCKTGFDVTEKDDFWWMGMVRSIECQDFNELVTVNTIYDKPMCNPENAKNCIVARYPYVAVNPSLMPPEWYYYGQTPEIKN